MVCFAVEDSSQPVMGCVSSRPYKAPCAPAAMSLSNLSTLDGSGGGV